VAILQHAEEVTANVAMTCRYYGISTKPTTATAAPKPPAVMRPSTTQPKPRQPQTAHTAVGIRNRRGQKDLAGSEPSVIRSCSMSASWAIGADNGRLHRSSETAREFSALCAEGGDQS